MAPVTEPSRSLVGRLGVDDRLARLEDAPVERLEHGRERRNHFGERPPDVLLGRQAVQRGERVVDADEAQIAVPEPDPDRRRDEQRIELRKRLLCRSEEERVVDRHRGAPGHLGGELEVRRPEAPLRLARPQRDRAEDAPTRLQRHDDVRQRPERLVKRQVLVVDGRAGERFVARVLHEVGLAGAQDLAHGMRFVLLRRVAVPELAEQLLALAIAVRDHDLAQVAVVDRVDDAVVGHLRNEQPGEVGQRRVDVKRDRQQRARLLEEPHTPLGQPFLGDVAEDVDHEPRPAVVVEDRRRAELRPTVLARPEEPVTDDAALGVPGHVGAPVREVLEREQVAVLADDLEPPQELRGREPEQFLAGAQATDARGGVVGIDELARQAPAR